MKSGFSISVLSCVLLLNACASHPAPGPIAVRAIPVTMSVTGDLALSEVFAREVRTAALQAIAHYAPNARPLNVSLFLDSAASGVRVEPNSSTSPQFRTLGTAGANRAQEGALPTVPVQPRSITGDSSQAYLQLRGTYSITDTEGRLIESKPLQVNSGIGNVDGIGVRSDLAMRTGEFVAMRVQALSR